MHHTTHGAAASGGIVTSLSGYQLLAEPLLNKGTAFSEQERDVFDLHGLLPPSIGTLADQVWRRLQVLRSFATDLERYAFLRDLQDTNETLFFALLEQHVAEFLPVVYTPTARAGCQQFSYLYRRPCGLFLSPPQQQRIAAILAHPRYDAVQAIVVTDGERILGLGDQGAGGMGIPIGKMALYSACGGLHPATTPPIMLDVGTDNQECLDDPLYIGWRHERLRGDVYAAFIDAFVQAVKQRWPHVLLQWEDFAKDNATRLLARYRDQLCTFNDDIQGTAAVATGTLLAAIRVTGVPLGQQCIAIIGAGSAGCGIADLIRTAMLDAGLTAAEAATRFYMVDRPDLLVEGMDGLADFQRPFLQAATATDGWTVQQAGVVSLCDVVRNANPTALIGVSGQPGAFTEQVVRLMASRQARPIIFPPVQSHRAGRSDAGRPVRVDGRPRHRRHRQPVCARHAERRQVHGGADQQCLHFSRRGTGHHHYCTFQHPHGAPLYRSTRVDWKRVGHAIFAVKAFRVRAGASTQREGRRSGEWEAVAGPVRLMAQRVI